MHAIIKYALEKKRKKYMSVPTFRMQ